MNRETPESIRALIAIYDAAMDDGQPTEMERKAKAYADEYRLERRAYELELREFNRRGWSVVRRIIPGVQPRHVAHRHTDHWPRSWQELRAGRRRA